MQSTIYTATLGTFASRPNDSEAVTATEIIIAPVTDDGYGDEITLPVLAAERGAYDSSDPAGGGYPVAYTVDGDYPDSEYRVMAYRVAANRPWRHI